MSAVPVVVAGALKSGLDHRAGFLLTFVDGMSSVEDILDASGLARAEAMGILVELVRKGVIAVKSR